MSDAKLSTEEASFIQALAARGGSAGNISLRADLAWSEDAYERIRSGLIEAGFIRAGRGRGGSVILEERVKQAIKGDTDKSSKESAPEKKRKAPTTKRGKAGKAASDANLGFEAELFKAADKLRGNMEPADYKHVALGLIFLKYISDAFEAQHAELAGRRPAGGRRPRRIPRRQRLLGAEGGALGAPAGQRQAARNRQADRRRDGRHREGNAVAQRRAAQGLRPPGAQQDHARRADRPDLRHRAWAKADRSPATCSAASTNTSSASSPAPKASAAASSTRRARSCALLVEMLEPYKGRVYDPCCGSGGMFVQCESSSRSTAGASATSPSTGRRATTPPGGWPR